MAATEEYLKQATPESLARFEAYLSEPGGSVADRWVARQGQFLKALDMYVDAELEHPADFEIASHEAGGQCRVWFPHYRVRGRADMMGRMQAILSERLSWAGENLFHGYVDCHEVHHEPETFLYFQMPFMHLTGDPKAVAGVEDLAHHAGNWIEGVPEWYDWDTHSFRSTWLGTREIRAFPPYDYQEANHFRFVAIGLGAYAGTGDGKYLELAEDYATRWCGHIEACAARGEPIPCSILPEGARRREMGYGGGIKEEIKEGEYPIFYSTVAPNTAYDITTVLLDLYRLTGKDRYREVSEAMIAQFFDHADAEGRPASQFAEGAWQPGRANDLLVRMTEKYRAVTGETRFDAEVLRWAETVDETNHLEDQLHIALLVAAHRIAGDAQALDRACAMAIRGMAVTEAETRWHQCDGRLRYGFKYLVETLYHPILAGVDYATRGGLPMIGLAYETDGRPGLPDAVAVRTWEPSPDALMLEAVNGGDAPAAWRISGEGSGGSLVDLAMGEGDGAVEREGEGWRVTLPPGGQIRLQGRWEGRGKISGN